MDRARSNLEKSRSWPVVVLGLLVVAVGAFLGWALWSHTRQAEPPVEASAATQVGGPAPTAAAAPGPAAPASGADLAASLEAISPHVLFRRVIALADAARRWAAVTGALAAGESPRAQLSGLKPASGFLVAHRGERTVIAPESYRRYDDFGDAVRSVDAGRAAFAYRVLHPALEEAYRALGYPGGAIDDATLRALRRLEAAPVVDEDVDVGPGGAVFTFSDPRLETLNDVDKHLLRMGPRNTRIIQAKARELREALGLPTATAQASPASR